MPSSLRKTSIISLSVIIAVVLVFISWSSIKKDSEEIYSASNDTPSFEAKLETKDGKSLKEWEQEILSRTASPALARGSITDNLTKNVLEEYFLAKQQNIELNEEKFAGQVLTEAFGGQKIDFKEYSVSDLKLSPDNSPESLKNYANKIGSLAKKNSGSGAKSEISILFKALELEDESQLEKLNPTIQNYKSLVDELLKMETPTEAVNTHLELVNIFSEIAPTIEDFKFYLEDPFRGYFAFSNYMKLGAEMRETLTNLDTLLKGKGIIFKEGEAGLIIEKAAYYELPK